MFENSLINASTTINGVPAKEYLDSFYKKRFAYQNATRLGQLLLRNGQLSSDNLDEALEIQTHTQKPLGEVLIDEGFCKKEVVEKALEKQLLIRSELNEIYDRNPNDSSLLDRLLQHISC